MYKFRSDVAIPFLDMHIYGLVIGRKELVGCQSWGIHGLWTTAPDGIWCLTAGRWLGGRWEC